MREALILALLALAACAGGSSVNGTGGHGGSGGVAGGGTGGAALGGDALPQNAVSFFNAGACPDGWSPYDAAAGRFVVPTTGNAAGGIGHGIPLKSGEDRTHTHAIAASFTLGATSYAGIAGEASHGVGRATTVTLATTSDPASLGLPYVQLLACKKMVPAVPRAKPLPAKMQLFFDDVACPDGWQQVAATQGRFVVGLPKGAPADLAFGGAALGSAGLPAHAHGNDVALVTTPHGILLASGGDANGYAANGTYEASEDTDMADPGVPYVQLLQCEKM